MQNSSSKKPVLSAPVLRGQEIRDAALTEFRNRPVVILSTHFDNACFSLGSFLLKVGHGHLVNIFTHGDHLVPKSPPQGDVFGVRDREDADFATRCGLTRHDLGCEEPSRRGRLPSDLSQLEDDLDQIARPVLAKLAKLADGFGPARGALFAPLGVGRHVNHRAVNQLVLDNLEILGAHYDIYLYEELPYAGNAFHRLAALWRTRKAARLGARHVLRLFWPQKRTLLQFYPSQHAHIPQPARFRPRAIFPRTPHEAFWPIAPKLGQGA